MERPWIAEHPVEEHVAAALIEERFPDLAPVSIRLAGIGWDNTAYLVNETWIFRFPRRAIAIPLLATEIELLPAIADTLPLPIPVPTRVARGDERFPIVYAGYERLPGRTADTAHLDETQRAAAAPILARFLARLHATPRAHAAEHGARPDAMRRLVLEARVPQVLQRLDRIAALGLVPSVRPFEEIIETTPADWRPRHATLVHGDLYARHVLVDDACRPAGVIDWGDAHLGDAAIDLGIAHGFLPPAARETFREVYGAIDEDTWRMARFKALHSAVMVIVYGHDVGDRDLLDEGLRALTGLER